MQGFTIGGGFWNDYQELVARVMLPYQYAVLNDSLPDPEIEKSHSVENFRIAAGEADGAFYGQVFQDSDTAKWLEAVAYTLQRRPDPALEAEADALIDLIGRAQQPDGYLNTYFTVKRPTERWRNLLEGHELYCAGHMIEAGVAYYEATGKTKLLSIVRKNADLIYDVFVTQGHGGCPGHPEIELALLRLYRVTGEARYKALAEHFLNARGQKPNYFAAEAAARDWCVWGMDPQNTDYQQNTVPVREATDAVGHAVRAVYLYTGMAMAARENGDPALIAACERLWRSIVDRRMYLTGGIGSTAVGEAFTVDDDLPNDTAYCETCASVGLIFFARAMLQLQNRGEYADVMELALYNTVLAGLQRDGTRFLYTNPLEVDPDRAGRIPALRHVCARRPKWHACACCPPNAARLIASLDCYVWHQSGDTLFLDLFIAGEYRPNAADRLTVETDQPYGGTVRCTVHGAPAHTLALHAPGWSRRTTVTRNGAACPCTAADGYLYIQDLRDGDTVTLTLDMTPHRVYASPRITADLGKCALMAGPLVYCFEDADNGGDLRPLCLCPNGALSAETVTDPALGRLRILHAVGRRTAPIRAPYAPYSFERPASVPETLTAVPYFLWGNRAPGRMKVWLPESAE